MKSNWEQESDHFGVAVNGIQRKTNDTLNDDMFSLGLLKTGRAVGGDWSKHANRPPVIQ